MKSVWIIRLLLAAGLLGSAGDSQSQTPRSEPGTSPAALATNAAPRLRVRLPAVAGLFYPADPAELSKTLDGLLARAPAQSIPKLRALICPHAGYPYSGPTAAIGYKNLAGRDVRTVIILAASHYADFRGASVPDAEVYRTPLGDVPISEKARRLVGSHGFVLEPRCRVARPQWSSQGPKPAPAAGEDTPETWEHSLEVQVPFLQRTLTNFALVPVILGEADPAQVAAAVAGILDDQTIVVASTDLSHYHSQAVAKDLDNRCVKAIVGTDIDAMKTQEACGKLPVLALMHLARLKGWKALLLDRRTSGDATGEQNRVVGYAAIAFHETGRETYSAAERKYLLDLAAATVARVATNGSAPEVNAGDVPPKLAETRACFVTLTKKGALRGCIGHIQPQEPLYRAVADNALSAATRDFRFAPVQADEVGQIKIEISVLTEPQPLAFDSPEDLLAKLKPGEDGVVLTIGPRSATFLPQVWEHLPDKVEFLNQLSRKAGHEPSAWRGKDTSVSIYHVEAFGEAN
jgi:AmmeMemoRadiSam system protein A